MDQTLPSFRQLVIAAADMHLEVVPSDGAALVLAAVAPALPLREDALWPLLMDAQHAADAARAAFRSLPGTREARLASDRCGPVQDAYHRAVVAYFGHDF